jgi:tetratricopeptide (TPR) repeat protein
MAQSGVLELFSPDAAESQYNLLVQGFRAGRLSLKKEAPPGLARLADPYDPAANAVYRDPPYRLLDLSYYNGRLYLYFGVTPALILFWPYTVLTGEYLFHRQAVVIFCAIGFLASVGLLRGVWRRYFSEVSVWVMAACALALGLATGVPASLSQSDFYEVPISCGYMLTMLALGAIWMALDYPSQQGRWLAAASLVYGLAVGARPSLLLGAVILLVPVAQAWRERRPIGAALIAATIPITLIGAGLMLYNVLRFDSPFEFGQHYQLGGARQVTMQFFSSQYFRFDFLVNFLEPARWNAHFPFVHKPAVPPLPSGYFGVQDPFGVLTNIPLVWLALVVPLAWRERSDQERDTLRLLVAATALLFGMCASLLGFYNAAAGRYEVDFLPALVLLAVVGIFGLERALADRPVRRRAARWGWSALLGFSVAFNVLVSVKNYSYAGCSRGIVLAQAGRVPEAIRVFENVIRIDPDYDEAHNNLGFALWQAGKRQEAMREYERALRINPDSAEAHLALGAALIKLGRPEDAIRHYEQALQIAPDSAETHRNLGVGLEQVGRVQEAIGRYKEALRINPDSAEAHDDLGNAFLRLGKLPEAIEQYQQALKFNPDSAVTHNNLGGALFRQGKLENAISHYTEALRITPNSPEAHNNLGTVFQREERLPEAVAQYQQALRIKPDYVEAHFNLGLALEKLGRTPEAIEHYQQALKLRPDFAPATQALARLQASQMGR